MNNSQFSPSLRRAELGGIYLGAMAVVAKSQRRCVLNIEYDEIKWPGRIEFDRPVITHFERDFAKHGHDAQRSQVDRGVMILLAGVTAIDLIDQETHIHRADANVERARKALREVDWWYSEAEAHLSWLRHRVARLLAVDQEWKVIAALAQAIMVSGTLDKRQIAKVIATAKPSSANSNGRTILIQRESEFVFSQGQNDVASADARPSSHRRQSTMTDGIVTQAIVGEVSRALAHADVRRTAVARMNQVEPSLLAVIRANAQTVHQKFPRMPEPHLNALRDAVFQSGLVVAEVMRRAVRELWCIKY